MNLKNLIIFAILLGLTLSLIGVHPGLLQFSYAQDGVVQTEPKHSNYYGR